MITSSLFFAVLCKGAAFCGTLSQTLPKALPLDSAGTLSQTLPKGTALWNPTTSPLVNSLTLYKSLSLLSAGNNRGKRLPPQIFMTRIRKFRSSLFSAVSALPIRAVARKLAHTPKRLLSFRVCYNTMPFHFQCQPSKDGEEESKVGKWG